MWVPRRCDITKCWAGRYNQPPCQTLCSLPLKNLTRDLRKRARNQVGNSVLLEFKPARRTREGADGYAHLPRYLRVYSLVIPISSMGNPLALDLGRPTRAHNLRPEAPATSRNVYRPPGTDCNCRRRWHSCAKVRGALQESAPPVCLLLAQ